MNYTILTNEQSNITRLFVILPGIDSLKDSELPQTTNCIEKYAFIAEYLVDLESTGSAAIVIEYPGPHAWGENIDPEILRNDVSATLKAAITELNTKSNVALKTIDIIAHSYGATALSIAAKDGGLVQAIEAKADLEINIHLFEPYGIAAMASAKENSRELREHDVFATCCTYLGIDHTQEQSELANMEIHKLKQLSSANSVNIILGNFKPSASIHNAYGALENVIKLDGLGHGAGLLDLHKARQKNQNAPEYAIEGFKILTLALAKCISKNSVCASINEPERIQHANNLNTLNGFSRYKSMALPVIGGITVLTAIGAAYYMQNRPKI